MIIVRIMNLHSAKEGANNIENGEIFFLIVV